MSKKKKIEHETLAQMPLFAGKTREELLALRTIPEDSPSGSVGKYTLRVESAKRDKVFNTPGWEWTNVRIVPGKYTPKTKRGIFDLFRQACELLDRPTGHELSFFVYHNVDLTIQNSPYAEGRPCVPWIEDYIAGAIAEKNQYLAALGPNGEVLQPRKPEKKTKK